jgi:hypothetical protein
MGFMRMAITWRNPHPVQTSHRYAKVTDIASGSVYAIQEVICGEPENKRGRFVHSSSTGRRKGVGYTFANQCELCITATAAKGERELTQALVVSRICSLFGLRRGVSSVAKNVQL